jgi:hypothetical protein
VVISAAPASSSPPPSSTASSFPFQVTTRVAPGSAPGALPNQARVEYNSSLLRGTYSLDDRQTITGLTQYNPDGSVADASWFLFDYGNDLIWLEITMDETTNLATAATIDSYGLGGGWVRSDPPQEDGEGSGFFEYDDDTDDNGNTNYTQTVARIQIFSSTTSSSGAFPVTNAQLLNSHLIMKSDLYSGKIAKGTSSAVIGYFLPMPFAAPYVSS